VDSGQGLTVTMNKDLAISSITMPSVGGFADALMKADENLSSSITPQTVQGYYLTLLPNLNVVVPKMFDFVSITLLALPGESFSVYNCHFVASDNCTNWDNLTNAIELARKFSYPTSERWQHSFIGNVLTDATSYIP
jgi:hypothetical protein